MNNWLKFIGSGLFIAALGEIVNNFIITIPGHSPLGNFIGAMLFYSVMLSFAYQVGKRFKIETPADTLWYMLFFGVGVGLLFNEWFLVGNSPANQNTSSVISQFSMIAYHTTVYTFPILVLSSREGIQIFVRKVFWRWSMFSLLTIISLSVVKMSLSSDFVLGLGIILTYFLGYNIFFLSVLYTGCKKSLGVYSVPNLSTKDMKK